jgi:uncharacterized protein (TIGR04255 family)
MSEVEDREIYPNAPLQLVAWEMRTPSMPLFQTPTGVVQSMSGRLRDLVPIVSQPETVVSIDAAQQPRPEPRQRLMDRKQTLAISFSPSAAIIETTAYTKFEDFAEVIERVLRALESAEAASGFERVGIRYIDEIRVPGVEGPEGWSGYIDDALLVGLSLEDARVKSTQTLTEYLGDPEFFVTLRSGALVGRTVDPSGALRVQGDEDGPYFLLDIDSYWTKPSDEPIPEFSATAVLATTKRLRKPLRTLFERSITDKLRDEVLRRRAG